MADTDELTRDVEIELQCELPDGFVVILVYGRKYPVPLTQQTLRMAWKIMVIPSFGQATFSYPAQDMIGSFFYEGETKIIAGPFEAQPGSSWTVSSQEKSQIKLEEDNSQQPFHMQHQGYFIYNKETISNNEDNWNGCIVNTALYKEGSERPLLSKQCRVGNVVALKPTTKLYICAIIPSYSAICNEFSGFVQGSEKISQKPFEFAAEDIDLLPDSEFSPMFELDLVKYSRHGGRVCVKIQDERMCGKLSFIPSTIN